MSRSDTINRQLRTLSTNTPDIEGAALVDNDGLMIASALSQDVDDDSIAAMSAAQLGISERIVSELGRGDVELVMTRGTNGFVILTRCGDEAVLTVLTTASAKLGLVFLDIKRAAKELAKLL